MIIILPYGGKFLGVQIFVTCPAGSPELNFRVFNFYGNTPTTRCLYWFVLAVASSLAPPGTSERQRCNYT